jgi:hypothetical protein
MASNSLWGGDEKAKETNKELVYLGHDTKPVRSNGPLKKYVYFLLYSFSNTLFLNFSV